MKSSYFSLLSLAVKNNLDIICKDFMKDYEQFARRNNRPKAKTRVSSARKKSGKSNSPQQYRRAINTLLRHVSGISSIPSFIANFDEVIAVLYDAGKQAYAKQVAQIAYYYILSNNLQNITHTTRTAIKVFVDYVNCRRKTPSYSSSALVGKITNDIDSFCNQHQLYSKSDLISKMETRLRRQDRLSGNKIWLPLGLISKIFNPNGSNNPKDKRFINWINSIAQNIYIHYYDSGIVNASMLKGVAAIELESNPLKSNPNNRRVYVILEKGGRYVALSPTGVLNKKEYMEINSIKDIVIDHVKPIDLTLRHLGSAGSLTQLDVVSKAMQLNKNVLNAYKNLPATVLSPTGKNNLYDELFLISGDSPCRLMTADLNSEKSNLTEYKYIRKVKNKKEYFGIVYGDDVRESCNDQFGSDYVICHQLDNSFPSKAVMIYTMKDFIKLDIGTKNIEIRNIDINLI